MSMNYTQGFPPMEDSALTPFERMQRALARSDYDLRYRRNLQLLRILQMMLFESFINPKKSNLPKNIVLEYPDSIFKEIHPQSASSDEIYKIHHTSLVSNKAFFQENFSKKINDPKINDDLDAKDYNFKTVAAMNGFYPPELRHNGLETSSAATLSFKSLVVLEMAELSKGLSVNYDNSLPLHKNIEVEALTNPKGHGYPNIITAFLSDNTNILSDAMKSQAVQDSDNGFMNKILLSQQITKKNNI